MKAKQTGSYILAIASISNIIIIILTLILGKKFFDSIVYSILQIIDSVIVLVLSSMYIKKKIPLQYSQLYSITDIVITVTIGIIEIFKFQTNDQCCEVFFTPITTIVMLVGSFIILVSKNKESKNEIKTTN